MEQRFLSDLPIKSKEVNSAVNTLYFVVKRFGARMSQRREVCSGNQKPGEALKDSTEKITKGPKSTGKVGRGVK
jgi:hypothetical protein